MDKKKVSYIEGLRGFAALQVVIFHTLYFFLPAVGPNPFWLVWQQALREVLLFFAVDGTMAVSIFFLLSGYILTLSFEKSGSTPIRNIAKRWVRLQLPVFAAMTFAFLLVTLSGKAHLLAAQMNGSFNWASVFYNQRPEFTQYAVETFIVTLWTGYSESNLFIAFGNDFFSGTRSLNPPLWSLNAEFWGSLLIILLAYLHHRRSAYLVALTCTALLFFMHPVGLFLCGHVMARLSKKKSSFLPLFSKTSHRNTLGLLFLSTGIVLSSVREQLIPVSVFTFLNDLTWFKAQSPFHYVGGIAGFFIFAGVLVAPVLRKLFSASPLLWLGRISFGIYLLHLPILFTITASLQLAFTPALGPAPAALCAALAGFTLTLLLGSAFAKWIDAPAITLARAIGKQPLF